MIYHNDVLSNFNFQRSTAAWSQVNQLVKTENIDDCVTHDTSKCRSRAAHSGRTVGDPKVIQMGAGRSVPGSRHLVRKSSTDEIRVFQDLGSGSAEFVSSLWVF